MNWIPSIYQSQLGKYVSSKNTSKDVYYILPLNEMLTSTLRFNSRSLWDMSWTLSIGSTLIDTKFVNMLAGTED